MPHAQFVFLAPPSFEDLRDRVLFHVRRVGIDPPTGPVLGSIGEGVGPEQLKVADLEMSAGDAKSTQNVAEVTPAPARGAGEKFEDDGTGAAKVADFLKEAKVI